MEENDQGKNIELDSQQKSDTNVKPFSHLEMLSKPKITLLGISAVCLLVIGVFVYYLAKFFG